MVAVLCEATMLAGFLYIRPFANVLGHAPPNAAGYLVALLAIPCVLIVDAIQKRLRKPERPYLPGSG